MKKKASLKNKRAAKQESTKKGEVIVQQSSVHMSNPVEEFLVSEAGKVTKFSELFKGNDEFIDQMSELTGDEVRMINTLNLNDRYLRKRGLLLDEEGIFTPYVHKHMRLMVSHQRKSRDEYVRVHNAEEKQRQDGGFGMFGRKNEIQP